MGHSDLLQMKGITVRDRIREIQKGLRDTAITPERTRDWLVTLTALLGNVNDELRAADTAYKQILATAMATERRANRARIVAEITPEYQYLREVKDTQTLVTEMMRSCRAYLRSIDLEVSLTR